MNLVTALLDRPGAAVERRNMPLTPQNWRDVLDASAKSAAGKVVTVDAAMRQATVFACVRLLAETIASLPLFVYRRIAGGKERAPEFSLYSVLHDLANDEMTAMEVRENIVGHMFTWGRAFAEIERNGRGDVIGLWPLRPNWCQLVRPENDGRLWLRVDVPGLDTGKPKPALPPGRFLRVRGFSLWELDGMSPIAQGRETIGLALAEQEYGARLYSQNAQPGGVLETDKRLTDEVARRMADSWQAAHAGLDNAHRVAILEEGTKWHATGMSPENTQFLESRKLSRSELASLFGVKPHMIGDLERSTFSNIEHQGIEAVVYTFRPSLVRIEQALGRDCLTPDQRRVYFCEHMVDGLLRGDAASRWAAYTQALDRGVLSINDVRALENQNPIENGDVHFVPMNMQTLENALKPPEPPPAPVPPGDDGGEGEDDDKQAD